MSIAQTVTLAELEADPYPIYEELRRTAPVVWLPLIESWLVTRWDDCEKIGAEAENWKQPSGGPTAPRVFGEPNVITLDGPAHVDQRRGVDPSIEPRRLLRDVDGIVQPIAKAYLEQIRERGSADLTQEFFEPVSTEALRNIMGMQNIVDTATFVRWFHDLSAGTSNFDNDEELWRRSDLAGRQIDELLTAELARLRSSPMENSMLSHMVHAGREGGQPRTDAEIIPTIKVIILGGAQEPGHAAASTMLGLLQNPDQLAEVVDDPDLIATAVQEGLRWIAPIQLTERQAVGDQLINGVTIPAGSGVTLALASANRDETRFENANVFDLGRPRSPHQSFGHGKHFCAGHFFARHVQRIMFEELLTTLPNLRVDPESQPVISGFAFRGPKVLPVIWDEAP